MLKAVSAVIVTCHKLSTDVGVAQYNTDDMWGRSQVPS